MISSTAILRNTHTFTSCFSLKRLEILESIPFYYPQICLAKKETAFKFFESKRISYKRTGWSLCPGCWILSLRSWVLGPSFCILHPGSNVSAPGFWVSVHSVINYKVWQKGNKRCDRYYKVWQLLQCVTESYYKVWQALQSVSIITKRDVTDVKKWQTM